MADDDITGSMMREIARLTAERASLQRQINSWALDHSAQLQGYKRDLDLALADSAGLRSALEPLADVITAIDKEAPDEWRLSVNHTIGEVRAAHRALSTPSRSEHIVEVVRAADAAREILAEPFSAGTRVVNCMVHTGALTERPRDCEKCATDIRNQLAFAIRVNEFLNDKVDRIKARLTI